MRSAGAILTQLETTWSATADVCQGLEPPDWDLPTDCPGWTVRDQVSHIIGTESMLLGRPGPPAPPEPGAHVRNELGRLNEAWVAARRDRPGAEVLAEFREVTAERLATLRALPAERWDEDFDSPLGRQPYRDFIGIRLFDCYLHEQDIRRAVGRPGNLDGDLARMGVDRLSRAMGRQVARAAAAPEGSVVAFELSGPAAAGFAVTVAGGRGVVGDAEAAGAASATLRTDTETFVLLCAGRLDPEAALAGGRLRLEGDRALGERVAAAMNVLF